MAVDIRIVPPKTKTRTDKPRIKSVAPNAEGANHKKSIFRTFGANPMNPYTKAPAKARKPHID